jgi:hypothetical protein
LEKEYVDYGEKIVIENKRNFNESETKVVLECIDKLLRK